MENVVGGTAMIILGGIIAIIGILILTNKLPLPGGPAGRLFFGALSVLGGAYILWGVAN